MASLGGGSVLGRVQRLFGRGTVAGLGERELLERFVGARDEGAFEAILDRFGPMVLGVCRRALDDPHDVDDAFQATFLVLVARAPTIRDGDKLGPWLHGVATKVATRARTQGRQRRRRETGDLDGAITEAPREVERRELRAVLDEELERLPASYRQPIVLCYLQGQTHDEAAARLHWPVGTVRSRMARGRDLLRGRLARRGLALSTTTLVLEAEVGPATVSAALIKVTLEAAMRVAAGKTIAAGMVSAAVASLAQGVTTTMMITTWTWTAGVVLALGLAGGGIGVAALQDGAGGQVQGKEPTVAELKTQLDVTRKQLADSQRREAELAGSVETLQGQIAKIEGAAKKDEAVEETARGLREEAPAEGVDTSLRVSKQGRAPKDLAKNAAPPEKGMMQTMMEAGEERGMREMMGRMNRGDVGMAGMGMPSRPGGMSGMPGGGASGEMAGMMMGGGNGMMGMGGMMGMTGAAPGYISSGSIFSMIRPRDGKFAAYSVELGLWDSYTLPPDVKKVVPVISQAVAMLMMEGPRITQVAAFSAKKGWWVTQDLREPTTKVTPIIGGWNAVYVVDRFVYAYSDVTSTWGVLELETGAKPVPSVGPQTVTVEHAGKLHIFSGKLAKWSSIEIKTPE
jgi:RNA polymerase sigma factor (sigma-70 family)